MRLPQRISSMTQHTVNSPLPGRRQQVIRWSLIPLLLVIGLIVSCEALDVLNGHNYCSPQDLRQHTSPCRRVLSVPGPTYHIYQVTFSPDSHLLAVTTSQHVTIWDVAS